MSSSKQQVSARTESNRIKSKAAVSSQTEPVKPESPAVAQSSRPRSSALSGAFFMKQRKASHLTGQQPMSPIANADSNVTPRATAVPSAQIQAQTRSQNTELVRSRASKKVTAPPETSEEIIEIPREGVNAVQSARSNNLHKNFDARVAKHEADMVASGNFSNFDLSMIDEEQGIERRAMTIVTPLGGGRSRGSFMPMPVALGWGVGVPQQKLHRRSRPSSEVGSTISAPPRDSGSKRSERK